MQTSSEARSIFNILILTILVFILLPAAYAKKGGGGGGKPGSGDPPVVCNDVFPGFVYTQEATRKTPGAIYLASSEACREPVHVATPTVMRFGPSLHVTADGSAGVVLWIEEPDGAMRYIVKQVNFTIDSSGLKLLDPVTLPLPYADGVTVPPGDEIYYYDADVWGDATHESLYVVINQLHRVLVGPGPNIWKLLIYDLKSQTLTNEREINNGACYAGSRNPQFDPTCYSMNAPRWNSSGTRLFVEATYESWYGALRIHINKGNGSLTDWSFSEPELVYAGISDPFADYDWPHGALIRPPDPGLAGIGEQDEFLAMTFLDRTGKNTEGVGAILDVEFCVGLFAGLESGIVSAPDDHWLKCLGPNWFSADRQYSWQSHDALLIRKGKGLSDDLYRFYVPSELLPASSELLIEDATYADAGF